MAIITNEGLYPFIKFDYRDLSKHKGIIEQIESKSIDGIVIENVLDREFCKSIVNRFHTAIQEEPAKNYYYPAPFGKVFGTTLMESDLNAYFSKAKVAVDTFEYMFEHKFKALVYNTLAKLGLQSNVFPTVHAPNQIFSLAGIRILDPGRDSLEAHIHQEFPLHFPSYQAVAAQLDLTTELSYYMVLQKPEVGGELVLYDLTWENTPEDMLSTNVFMSGIRAERLSQYDQMKLDLEAGDMILFAANRIWHKVAAVTGGSKSRITIGGFLAKSKNKTDYGIFI